MNKIINVKDVLQTNLAVGADEGKYIFSLIRESIEKKEYIIIDFTGITSLTTAFLNYAIGELYTLYDPDKLNSLVKIDAETLTLSQKKKVNLVMRNSKNKIDQKVIDKVTNYGEID